MIELKQELRFSTTVSDTTPENEFIVEFFTGEETNGTEGCLIKITHNFDELLDFLDELEQ